MAINHALTHESYRSADPETSTAQDDDLFVEVHSLDGRPSGKRAPLYFEVLAVEALTEEQERKLRKEAHGWRRPDDDFIYEIVVVSNARRR